MNFYSTIFILFSQYQSINFNCATNGGEEGERFKKGEMAHVCLHFLPYGIKTVFEVEVDKMAIFTVRRSYELLKKKDNDFSLQLQNNSILSNMVVNQQALFENNKWQNQCIWCDDGNIKWIESEDLSDACNGGESLQFVGGSFTQIEQKEINACPFNCTQENNDNGKCDLKIQITWVGTDKKGNTLTSASEKLGNFKNFNLDKMYDEIMNTNTDPQTGGNPITYDTGIIAPTVISRIENPVDTQTTTTQPTQDTTQTDSPQNNANLSPQN